MCCGCCRQCLGWLVKQLQAAIGGDVADENPNEDPLVKYKVNSTNELDVFPEEQNNVNREPSITIELEDIVDSASQSGRDNEVADIEEHIKNVTDTPEVEIVFPGEESEPTEREIYVALCYYKGTVDADLSFKKAEQLVILSKEDGDWWYAQSLSTKAKGYVPSNLVALEDSQNAFDWYYGEITRCEAERLLTRSVIPDGSFLVRKSGRQPGVGIYSLSVLNNETVLHYKIKKLEDGSYAIKDTTPFRSLSDLVDHYSNDSDGLAHRLTLACVDTTMKPPGLGKDAWEIERESLKMRKKLGHGEFAEVWLGVWKQETEVAIKKLKEGSMSREAFIEEATVLKRLRHKHLVQLYAICSVEEPIFIITEYLCHGSLHHYMTVYLKKERIDLPMRIQIDMMAQVASGMAYLESKNYIHRDLAARNILVGINNTCKVADFGLARLLKDEEYYRSTTTKLPIRWLALESCLFRTFTIKSDVWSFGILMTEIVGKGKMPYAGMSNHEVIKYIEKGHRMENPLGCPLELYSIMTHCWNKEPETRPGFVALQEKLETLCALGREMPLQ